MKIVVDDKDSPTSEQAATKAPPPSFWTQQRSPLLLISLLLGLVVVIGLAVGLSVGLTRNGNENSVSSTPTTATEPAVWIQQGQDIMAEGADDWFGHAVAMSDDAAVIAIGAPEGGYAKVAQFDGADWVDQTLVGAGARFGNSVAVSDDGTVLAMGGRGFVNVFGSDGTTWSPLGQTLIGDYYFGSSLSFSSDGMILAVGSTATNGTVTVFRFEETNWNPMGEPLTGGGPLDRFGESVSLSDDGTVLAVGATQHIARDDPPGYVQVFQWNGGQYETFGQTLVGDSSKDGFGASVSLSDDGTYLAVGAHGDDEAGGGAGQVRVFESDGMAWTQLGQTLFGKNSEDYFGFSVSLSSPLSNGAVLAVGAHGGNGKVLVFRLVEGAFVQLGDGAVGGGNGHRLGTSVALSADGMTVVAGADQRWVFGGGYVRVYKVE